MYSERKKNNILSTLHYRRQFSMLRKVRGMFIQNQWGSCIRHCPVELPWHGQICQIHGTNLDEWPTSLAGLSPATVPQQNRCSCVPSCGLEGSSDLGSPGNSQKETARHRSLTPHDTHAIIACNWLTCKYQVSAFRLSNTNKWRWWVWMVAAYRRTH